MSINVDLLNRTLAYIEEHPDEWNQSAWRCETGMCFAGTAALLAGGRWATPSNEFAGSHLLLAEPGDYTSPDVAVEDGADYGVDGLCGDVVRASERAQRILGLTLDQRLELFDGSNVLSDLRRIVGELTGAVAA